MRSQKGKDLTPLISVIMPTYNYAHYIGEALKSLQAQTYSNWECVVVDDGSTDITASVISGLSEQDARIKYRRQENRGQAAARNEGLRNSKGTYVQFLDADDFLESLKLERQIELLERRPDIDIVYSGARSFSQQPTVASHESAKLTDLAWMPRVSGPGMEILGELVRKNILPINSALIRRRVVEKVGFFDDTLPQSQAEDWDYWLRCALAGAAFLYDDDDGIRALVREHPFSSSRNLVVAYRAMLIVRNKLKAKLDDVKLIELNREMAASEEGYLGIELAVSGNRLRGALHLVRAAAVERKVRWRLKWLLCALAVPIVPRDRLRALVNYSLSQSAARLWQRSSTDAL